MKLRNKKTGQEGNFIINKNHFECIDLKYVPEYRSLAELSNEWEDHEEPKKYWYITGEGDICRDDIKYSEWIEERKSIGNYFETQEEAEKAVEKLKDWTRLEELETEILGWELRDMPSGGKWQTVNVKLNIKATKETMLLLDLLFRGEE